MKSKDKTSETVKYLFEAGQLKRVKRSGWWLIGVDNPETVAEHSFRTAVVGYVIASLEGLNPDKVAMTALFHDFPETRLNDMHKVGQRYIDFKDAEISAFREQVSRLPEKIRKDLSERIHYNHEDATPEDTAARDADYIECALQAKEYIDKGYKEAQDWLDNIKTVIRTETAKKMLAEIERTDSNSWWKGLKNIKR
ncbi:HD family hydrolase [Candidatus Woesearchaeota archaeon]|nr:HD family hydrolase [Candidatus Woesearchaeota archaeon]